jgi:Ca2+:H+ antiporter
MLFLAAFGLTVPSAIATADAQEVTQTLSLGVAIILIATYGLGLLFSLGTHREYFSSASHGARSMGPTGPSRWPLRRLAGLP